MLRRSSRFLRNGMPFAALASAVVSLFAVAASAAESGTEPLVKLPAPSKRPLGAERWARAVDAVRGGAPAPADNAAWAATIGAELDRALERSLRPVINATGVVLHTNLGRAPLARPVWFPSVRAAPGARVAVAPS